MENLSSPSTFKVKEVSLVAFFLCVSLFKQPPLVAPFFPPFGVRLTSKLLSFLTSLPLGVRSSQPLDRRDVKHFFAREVYPLGLRSLLPVFFFFLGRTVRRPHFTTGYTLHPTSSSLFLAVSVMRMLSPFQVGRKPPLTQTSSFLCLMKKLS